MLYSVNPVPNIRDFLYPVPNIRDFLFTRKACVVGQGQILCTYKWVQLFLSGRKINLCWNVVFGHLSTCLVFLFLSANQYCEFYESWISFLHVCMNQCKDLESSVWALFLTPILYSDFVLHLFQHSLKKAPFFFLFRTAIQTIDV